MPRLSTLELVLGCVALVSAGYNYHSHTSVVTLEAAVSALKTELRGCDDQRRVVTSSASSARAPALPPRRAAADAPRLTPRG